MKLFKDAKTEQPSTKPNRSETSNETTVSQFSFLSLKPSAKQALSNSQRSPSSVGIVHSESIKRPQVMQHFK